MDRPLHLDGQRAHHEPGTLDQRPSGKSSGNHRCMPVIFSASQITELDERVRQSLADSGNDRLCFHELRSPATPSSLPTVMNAAMARSMSSNECAADS